MTLGFGSIVLRDIPKQQARLDNAVYSIQGGFRGFQLVPTGPHYVGVVHNGKQSGCWCYLQSNSTIVKIFDNSSSTFKDGSPESAEHYHGLASSGAMGAALLPYNVQALPVWTGLTNHLTLENFPPRLNPIPSSVPNRFAHAFDNTHHGQAASFLAEFQFAFVSWYTKPSDQTPLKRWAHLVQALYNAGERNMARNPDLFSGLVDTMLTQFTLISDGEFSAQSPIGFGAKNFSEDLIDTDVDVLVQKGRAFEAYLTTRGLQIAIAPGS